MMPSRHGLARVLSKRGLCSRSEAEKLIRDGRVRLDGRVIRDPEHPADLQHAAIAIDGAATAAAIPRHLMLNKPRGLVTTLRDEHGRDTVYRCFDGASGGGEDMGHIAPVGRLDKASEGLLLFSNDPQWAARITDPATGPDKTYHVQVDCIPDALQLERMREGIASDGVILRAKSATLLRAGGKNAWLEIELEEGRNRQIRRLLQALDIDVLRLVRVAIGTLQLGELPKGRWRELTAEEVAALGGD
ncbi:MAG: rRNA pseudouridine synthase [Lysobacteraceae bacterium]|nr:MAG: rRNA pseudouridine synthase [Xanthomonadaceae bacterium]